MKYTLEILMLPVEGSVERVLQRVRFRQYSLHSIEFGPAVCGLNKLILSVSSERQPQQLIAQLKKNQEVKTVEFYVQR